MALSRRYALSGVRVRLVVIAGRSRPPNRENTFEWVGHWSGLAARADSAAWLGGLWPRGQSSIAW